MEFIQSISPRIVAVKGEVRFLFLVTNDGQESLRFSAQHRWNSTRMGLE